MKKMKWLYVLLATFLLTSCGTLMQPYQMDSKMKDIELGKMCIRDRYHPRYISCTKLKNILLSIDFLSKKKYFCDLNCHRHKTVIK